MFSSSVSILPSLRGSGENKQYTLEGDGCYGWLKNSELPSGVKLFKSPAKILRFVLFGETFLFFFQARGNSRNGLVPLVDAVHQLRQKEVG